MEVKLWNTRTSEAEAGQSGIERESELHRETHVKQNKTIHNTTKQRKQVTKSKYSAYKDTLQS